MIIIAAIQIIKLLATLYLQGFHKFGLLPFMPQMEAYFAVHNIVDFWTIVYT